MKNMREGPSWIALFCDPGPLEAKGGGSKIGLVSACIPVKPSRAHLTVLFLEW